MSEKKDLVAEAKDKAKIDVTIVEEKAKVNINEAKEKAKKEPDKIKAKDIIIKAEKKAEIIIDEVKDKVKIDVDKVKAKKEKPEKVKIDGREIGAAKTVIHMTKKVVINGRDYIEISTMNGETFVLSPKDFNNQVSK